MTSNGIQIQFSAKWTKRLALAMSILYLANPLYRPLNLVFHEVLNAFESPNKLIGHETNFMEDKVLKRTSHDHTEMHLETGHNLVDFVAEAMEASNDDKFPDKKVSEKVKIDKHTVTYKMLFKQTRIADGPALFWLLEKKPIKGYLAKSKEPPQVS